MKHPIRSDFDAAVTKAGVNVTFKPNNSIYSFYRLAATEDIAYLVIGLRLQIDATNQRLVGGAGRSGQVSKHASKQS